MINTLVKKYSLPPEQLEAAVNEAMGGIDAVTLDAMLMDRVPAYVSTDRLQVGDVVTGTVFELRGDLALIEFGSKSEGVLPYSEGDHSNSDLDIGDIIQVIIAQIKGNQIYLTRKGVERLVREDTTIRSLSPGDRVKGKVVNQTKSGWLLEINGCLTAFLPGAVSGIPPSRTLEEMQGREFEAEVTSVDVDQRQVVLDRKEIAEEERRNNKQNFLDGLEQDDIVEGSVKNITDFGLFIQIAPGVIGLCHMSDKGDTELEVGDATKARILKVDRIKNRVSLGIKQVSEPTWEELIVKYAPNDTVTGVVTSFVPYGAFVEIEPGLHGLVHISDISWSEHIRKPGDALEIGQEINAVILGIEMDRKRVSLGIKQINPDPWDLVEERYLVGGVFQGTVTAVKDFGAFVELEKGIDGLVHTKDAHVLPGDEVEVIITKIDSKARRINLKFC